MPVCMQVLARMHVGSVRACMQAPVSNDLFIATLNPLGLRVAIKRSNDTCLLFCPLKPLANLNEIND